MTELCSKWYSDGTLKLYEIGDDGKRVDVPHPGQPGGADGHCWCKACAASPNKDNLVREFWDTLNFCGCGIQGPVLGTFRDVLQTLHDQTALQKSDPKSWENGYAKRREIFGTNYAWEYLVYYVLDSQDLVEHGSSLPGWLTEEGEALLAAMAGKSDDELDSML